MLFRSAALILVGVYWYGYSRGYASSAVDVQARQQESEKAVQVAHDQLIKKLADEVATHAQKQQQVASELAQSRRNHSLALSAQQSVYEQRLLQSARRAEVYRDQAEASAASCRDLASHAARLDQALEEGRGLVNEFRETLGLRDQQLMLLARQIEADRQFFAGAEGDAK